MKPLTIEELKNLEVGDWVYIVHERDPYYNMFYAKKISLPDDLSNDWLYLGTRGCIYTFRYSEFDTKLRAYKNKEQAEATGEIVELPNGWIDTLKLLTVAAMCYIDIKHLIESRMKDSKDIADLYFECPNVQGSTNLLALSSLVESKLNCNKIKGFEDILNALKGE